MPAGGPAAGPCLLARTAAVVVVACAVLHAGTSGGAASLLLGLACLTCAVHLWRRPGPGAWGTHVVLAAGMAAHPLVAAAFPSPGHVHGGGTPWATAASLLAGAGLLLAAWRWWLGRDLVVWSARGGCSAIHSSARAPGSSRSRPGGEDGVLSWRGAGGASLRRRRR